MRSRFLVALVLAFGCLFMSAPSSRGQITPQPPVVIMSSTLSPGQTLRTGFWLTSSNSAYFALMRNDGTLCTYPGSDPQNQRGPATWCSAATAPGGMFYAEVKPDGKFCIYPGQPDGGAQSIWCVNATAPAGQTPYLVINGDGNLILNYGSLTSPTGFYWQTGVRFAQVSLAAPQYGAIRWSDDEAGLCPPACARNFLIGSTISLQSIPPDGGTFREWTSGRCTGAANVNPCVVQVTGYVPAPIGVRNTSSPYRILNFGQDGRSAPKTIWAGPPDGQSRRPLFINERPAGDPDSFFVIDGDTIRLSSNRNLCWSYHAPSYSMTLQACGSPTPNNTQGGWVYRPDDSTLRNTNFPGSCVYFNSDSHVLMVPGTCFVDDPRAGGAWWVDRWKLQP